MKYCSDGEVENAGDALVDVLFSLEEDLNRSFPFDKHSIKAIIEVNFPSTLLIFLTDLYYVLQ